MIVLQIIDTRIGLHKPYSPFTIPLTLPHFAVFRMSHLFRRLRPSSASNVVYSSCLATLYQGHALWYPKPHGTGEPQIGNVGYMDEGAFIRLFNLDSSKPEQQVTFWPTPFNPAVPLNSEVFKQLDKREVLRSGHYSSHGVCRMKISGGANV